MMTPLIPFEKSTGSFSVLAHAALRGCILQLKYEIRGDLRSIEFAALPDGSVGALRKDGLWKTTCFEAFLKNEEAPAYLEINLSPAGDWNIYRFDDYRSAMRPVPITRMPVIRIERGDDFFRLEAEMEMIHDAELEIPGSFDIFGAKSAVGLTAVVQTGQGTEYWAIRHTGSQPDFHRAESFTLKLSSI